MYAEYTPINLINIKLRFKNSYSNGKNKIKCCATENEINTTPPFPDGQCGPLM